MNYSFDILTLQPPSPKTQNSDHLNIIPKKTDRENGSWYQIAVVTSMFFIFFAKTPFFLFCSSSFLFALFLFPFVLLSSQPYFILCAFTWPSLWSFQIQVYMPLPCPSNVNFVRLHYLFYYIYIILYLVLIVYFIIYIKHWLFILLRASTVVELKI